MTVRRISAALCLTAAAAPGLFTLPPAAAAPDYGVLSTQNIFDPQRKPWPDGVAPPSTAAPFGPEDLQVQGTAIVGGVKRALVRLGGRLRQSASATGRPTMLLGEGQTIGGYVLESIEPQQLVFASGGNRFTIAINRTMPREPALAAAPLPPVIQGATVAGAPSPAPPQAPVSPFAAAAAAGPMTGAAAPSMGAAPLQSPFAAAPAAQPFAPPAAPPPVSTGGMTLLEAIQAAQAAQRAGQAPPPAPAAPSPAPTGGMSLLEAIQAAQAAQRAGQLPPTPVNPFLPKPQP